MRMLFGLASLLVALGGLAVTAKTQLGALDGVAASTGTAAADPTGRARSGPAQPRLAESDADPRPAARAAEELGEATRNALQVGARRLAAEPQ